MKIAVIGAGNIGGTVGQRWERAGHQVAYGLRDPSKRAGARSIAEALAGAEAVLLAVPGTSVVELARQHAKALDGKIVIDATNNVRAASANTWADLATVALGAKLYRAFNPVVGGVQADLFYCGAEGGGREVVERLIGDAGLRPIWVGGADQADTVDGALRLWFVLSRHRGRRIAFKLLSD